jgi:hypothetical protein
LRRPRQVPHSSVGARKESARRGYRTRQWPTSQPGRGCGICVIVDDRAGGMDGDERHGSDRPRESGPSPAASNSTEGSDPDSDLNG